MSIHSFMGGEKREREERKRKQNDPNLNTK
jgi:hypothetical protein